VSRMRPAHRLDDRPRRRTAHDAAWRW
jgi:hypothetical protein